MYTVRSDVQYLWRYRGLHDCGRIQRAAVFLLRRALANVRLSRTVALYSENSSMPFFSYPAPADWLLPILNIPLTLASLIFRFLQFIGLAGTSVLIVIAIAIFARNIMSPARP